MSDTPAPAAPAPEKRRGFSPLLGLGLVVLILLLAAGGWLVWLVWGTTWLAQGRAAGAVDELRQSWSSGEARPDDEPPGQGEAAWVLRFPTLGDKEWPVVAGVESDAIVGAIGWYPGSALPGQDGNTAVTGYRVTHGAPMADINDLEVGDEVIVESATTVWSYRIIHPATGLTVQADEDWVLDPVPGSPDTTATRSLLTLITSEDLVPTSDRSVAFAALESTRDK